MPTDIGRTGLIHLCKTLFSLDFIRPETKRPLISSKAPFCCPPAPQYLSLPWPHCDNNPGKQTVCVNPSDLALLLEKEAVPASHINPLASPFGRFFATASQLATQRESCPPAPAGISHSSKAVPHSRPLAIPASSALIAKAAREATAFSFWLVYVCGHPFKPRLKSGLPLPFLSRISCSLFLIECNTPYYTSLLNIPASILSQVMQRIGCDFFNCFLLHATRFTTHPALKCSPHRGGEGEVSDI